MAKRGKKKSSPRRWFRRKKGYKRKRTIPLAPIIGVGAGALFAAPTSCGYAHSPFEEFTSFGNVENGMKSLVGNVIGVGLPPQGSSGGVTFNVMNALNPFDMSAGAAWKLGLWGCVVDKIAGWVGVNRKMANLPAPLNKIRV